jgi:hypothetical protein
MKSVEDRDGIVGSIEPIELPVRKVDKVSIPLHLHLSPPRVEVNGGGVNRTIHSHLDK